MDTKQVIARFEAEEQALALMDHPNIATVFDAGATESGRPYFVMELVKGRPITDYCDAKELTTEQRLELFISVCHAVQHAHQKGIIHRDIKPSNVLVEQHDDKPVVKVIDFGVAKALHQPLTEKTLFTGFGQMVGTVLYMSPEQAELNALDVDTRSDVYSLGVLLYELLTGVTPFDRQRLVTAAFDEMRRIIREEEPPRPSTRISTLGDKATDVCKSRQTEPRRLSALVRGDLDWIAMKALEKDRSRRYESPDRLADDIQRFLLGGSVQAHPPSAAYRLRKFVRRNRLSVTATLLVLLAILLGIVGMIASLSRERFIRANLERQLYRYGINLAYQAWNEGNRVQLERLLTGILSREGIVPEFELRYLLARSHEMQDRAKVREIPLPATATRVCYTPDGRYLAIGCINKAVLLYDLHADRFVPAPQWLRGSHVTVSAGGTHLAVCSAPTPDAAISNRDLQPLQLLDIATMSRPSVPSWDTQVLSCAEFSPVESRIACAGPDGILEIRDVPGGELVWRVETDAREGVSQLVWSADGRLLAAATRRRVLGVWNVQSRLTLARSMAHEEYPRMAFSPDSKSLLIGGPFGGKLWSINGDRLQDTGKQIAEDITCASFSHDGTYLALGSADYKVRIWDAHRFQPLTQLLQLEYVTSIVFSPDGRHLAASGRDNAVRIWSTDFFLNREKSQGLRHFHPPLAVSHQGLVATCRRDGDSFVLLLWNPATGLRQDLARVDATIVAVAFSGDGMQLAAGGADGFLRIWPVAGGGSPRDLAGHRGEIRSLAFSPDGRFLVSGGEPAELYLWDLRTDHSRRLLDEQKGVAIQWVTFSANGRLAAGGGIWQDYGETTLWDLSGDAPRLERRLQHPRIVRCVAFSPDGRQVAVTHDFSKGDIRFFDTDTGEEINALRGHSSKTMCFEFTPDGHRLISGSDDRTVRFWEAGSGELVGTLRVDERVRKIAFLPDGNAFVTASWEGDVNVRRGAEASPQFRTSSR